MKKLFLIVFLFVMTAVVFADDSPQILDTQTEDICEAVFRFQFDYNHSMAQENAKIYYLKILGRDPSNEFLLRFKRNNPPVKKGSEFVQRKGILFSVISIRSRNSTAVHVQAEFSESPLSSARYSYDLYRSYGKWEVKQLRLEAM